ncbi:hypothetical protein A5881_003719 [Enterococcus termitis]|nr:hypothetical protein A5881_000091 [Enterococcus termitis]
MKTTVVAIDLGGSSGRVVLGELVDEAITFREIHRFKAYNIYKNNHIYWDINKIFKEIIVGLQLAHSSVPDFQSIGIDTWGVDFGLVGKEGLVTLPYSYRDKYTDQTYSRVQSELSKDYLFERTGLQTLEINSLFQLVAQKEYGVLDQAQHFLLIPDLLNYFLTGIARTELSIASTTQLINPYNKQWDQELIEKLDLPDRIFPELVAAGTVLGKVKSNIVPELSLDNVKVINVAAHDTASAVYSIPELKDHLFISSGTWSLLGLEVETPMITQEIMNLEFSNEKSASGKTLLLKNLTGLWLIEEAIRDYQTIGARYDYSKITSMIGQHDKNEENICFFDTDAPDFATPGNIVKKIQQFAEKTHQNVPQKATEIFESIYKSLAFKYRHTIDELNVNTDLRIEDKQLIIVGGGAKSTILCQYTANCLNKRVKAGLSEASAIGNCLMQFEANKAASRRQLEQMISKNVVFEHYEPKEVSKWNADYLIYKKIMEDRTNELS